MQKYPMVIHLLCNDFLSHIFCFIAQVTYLAIMVSFCHLTGIHVIVAPLYRLCNIGKRMCNIVVAFIFYNDLHLQLV